MLYRVMYSFCTFSYHVFWMCTSLLEFIFIFVLLLPVVGLPFLIIFCTWYCFCTISPSFPTVCCYVFTWFHLWWPIYLLINKLCCILDRIHNFRKTRQTPRMRHNHSNCVVLLSVFLNTSAEHSLCFTLIGYDGYESDLHGAAARSMAFG